MAEAATARPVGPRDRAVGPRDPTEVSARGWRVTLERTLRRLKRDRISVSAGSLAYHGFPAFCPPIIAALGVLTRVHLGRGTIHHPTHGLEKGLPAGAA